MEVKCWKCNECRKDLNISKPCMLSILIDENFEGYDPTVCAFNKDNKPNWQEVSGKIL